MTPHHHHTCVCTHLDVLRCDAQRCLPALPVLCLRVALQALVDHFAALGQPGRVEAVVVHLSIMSLDLNQVGWQ